MKIKAIELSGPLLDWAVARCEGDESLKIGGIGLRYSSDWSVVGSVIEREELQLWKGAEWNAAYGNSINPPDNEIFSGPTPLVAAMRCYVASKLGDEVEIPAELMEAA